MHPVHSSGPIVLGNEADGSPVESLNNEIAIILKVERSRRTSNRISSVAVDRRLHHHIRNGENHTLHSCRHSDAQHTAQLHPVNPHLVEMQPERFFLLTQQTND